MAGRARGRLLRHGLLLGRRADVLGGARGLLDLRRLPGWVHPNPTYEETCTGRTGHTEAVQVVYDPAKVSYADLLKVFWENHDPTQGMRQGNDVGTQYRSAIYTTSEAQLKEALASRDAFQPAVTAAGLGEITTEIAPAGPFYYAEDYHQQYLSNSKNPNGYCNHGPNGLTCPVGVARTPKRRPLAYAADRSGLDPT